MPESFRVLVKELQGLGLDVEVEFDDGTHGDIPIEDDEHPVFMGKPPEIFSSPRKPRKPRSKPQPAPAPLTDILAEAPAEEDSENMPEIADMLFESREPTAEELAQMNEEMLLNDGEMPERKASDIFDSPEESGEGEI